jgi:hypothetical protein
MESRRLIAEWYTSELDRIEKNIIQEQEKLDADSVQLFMMADNAINELDSDFKAAAANRQRKKEAFAKSIAASTPSDT